MNIIGRLLARTPLVKMMQEDQRKVEEDLETAKQQQHIASGMGTVIDSHSERQEFWAKANHVSQKVNEIVGGRRAHG